MDKKSILIYIIFAAIVIFLIFLIYGYVFPKGVSSDEMMRCEADGDCVPVGCGCSCSGCGGFSYEDVVNKKFENIWYKEHDCKKATICPKVCCEPSRTVCENKKCVVKKDALPLV